MTYVDAYDVLEELGYQKDDTVTVKLTGKVSVVVTAEEAGLSGATVATTRAAVDYGKNGNVITNGISYLKCLLFGKTLSFDETDSYNENAVREIVKEAASLVNAGAYESAYSIENGKLVIVKGARGRVINVDDICDMVYDAFADSNFTEITYEGETTSEVDIDLDMVHSEVSTDPKDAQYDKTTGEVSEHTTGRSFDIGAARRLYDAADDGDTIEIDLIYTEPEVTSDMLSDMLFRDVLAEKSTTMYTSSSNRISNISLAASSINDLILLPGEEFSFNTVVGKRTAERGYKLAGAYVNGATVDQLGGGICQVSSTIYYCVIHADLQVVERYNHGYTVAYLPLGMDATVDWGNIDFRFVNDTDYPVKMVAYVEDKVLYIKLVGTKTTDETVKIEYELISSTPYEIVEEVDESLAPGESKVKVSGYTGYVADTYKYVYDKDGELISKTFMARNTYRTMKRVILVGPEEEEVSPDPSPSDTGTSVDDPFVPPTTPSAEPSAPPADPSPDDPTGPDDPGNAE